MIFALDDDERYVLHSRQGGWDLIVDGARVYYCHTPREALRYLGEEMRDISSLAVDVCAHLQKIEDAITRATELWDLARVSETVARVMTVAAKFSDERERLVAASLAVGDCKSEAELRSLPARRAIVASARAMIAGLGT